MRRRRSLRKALYLAVLRRTVRLLRRAFDLFMLWATYASSYGDALGTQRLMYDLGLVDWKGKDKIKKRNGNDVGRSD
jgi:hypothetical protein